MTDNSQLLTLREVASILRISKSQVSKLVNGHVKDTPRLPGARLGRRVLIRKASLDTWLLSLDKSEHFG